MSRRRAWRSPSAFRGVAKHDGYTKELILRVTRPVVLRMNLTQYHPVLRLPLNTRGRDFVVGDVHGSVDLLRQGLALVRFNPEVDRLFLVGDLVDRGFYSRECLELLDKPWVWSARGNHEQMALESFGPQGQAPTDPGHLRWMRDAGMEWWLQLTAAQRLPLLRKLACLPFALEVETTRGRVGIIHAEVPPGMAWPEFIAGLEQADPHVLASCIWGRKRLTGSGTEGVVGIGRLFVGHTPQWGQLRRVGNIYAVDTGGVFGAQGEHPGGRLSLTNLVTRTALTALPQRMTLLNLLDDPQPSAEPFGSGPGYELSLPAACRSPWLSWVRKPR